MANTVSLYHSMAGHGKSKRPQAPVRAASLSHSIVRIWYLSTSRFIWRLSMEANYSMSLHLLLQKSLQNHGTHKQIGLGAPWYIPTLSSEYFWTTSHASNGMRLHHVSLAITLLSHGTGGNNAQQGPTRAIVSLPYTVLISNARFITTTTI